MLSTNRSAAISLSLTSLLALSLWGCNSHAGHATTTMRWSSGSGTRTLRVIGSAEFTEDDRDIKSVSPGGSVLIEDGSWLRSNRSYFVRENSNGVLERTYKAGGREQAIDAAAQAWIAGAMLTLIRETANDAGPRVDRILRKGGPAAVLREVGEIHSDGSRKRYLRELVERAHLGEDELRDVMRSARRIGSDGDKTELLIEVWSNYSKPNLRESWFTTLSGVGSDGDKRRALEHAIRAGSDPETLASAARIAENIGSDGDKSAVLSAIAVEGLNPEVRRSWLRAVGTIGSDGDKAHALLAALSSQPVDDPGALVEILQTAKTIGSDGDKARVLVQTARSDMTVPAVQRAFFNAASSIGSDGDRKHVLNSVLDMPGLPASLVIGIAEAAKGIGSDGDKASVLASLTESQMADPASRSAFFAAVNTIGSDGDRAQVLASILRMPSLAPETAVAAIDGAMRIGSDGEKAALLVLAAERHARTSPLIRTSLEKALRSVHSDGEYRRVAEALGR